jgi:hypothetical protein
MLADGRVRTFEALSITIEQQVRGLYVRWYDMADFCQMHRVFAGL